MKKTLASDGCGRFHIHCMLLQKMQRTVFRYLSVVMLFLFFCTDRRSRNPLADRYIRPRLLHRFVGRTHQFASGNQLLDTVSAPAGQTSRCKQRCCNSSRNVQRIIYETGIQVDIGRHRFFDAMDFRIKLRSPSFDVITEKEVVNQILALCQFFGHGFQYLGTRVG